MRRLSLMDWPATFYVVAACVTGVTAACNSDGPTEAELVGPGTGAPSFAKGGPSQLGALASVSGPLNTLMPQEMQIWKENGQFVGFQHVGEWSFDVSLDFGATRDFALADLLDNGMLDHCVVDAAGIAADRIRQLLAKLVDAIEGRAFSFGVDKTALGAGSADHGIGSTSQDEFGLYSMGVRAPTVTVVSGNINGDSRLAYTGGSVAIKDRSKRPHFSVACPNQEGPIIITVDRLP